MPGGTLEWGERLRVAIERELQEETGVGVLSLGNLLGVYSDPGRDQRFHAVTVVVAAEVSEPMTPPKNPLEILEVGLFQIEDLPKRLSLGMSDMLRDAIDRQLTWE